MGSRMDKYNVDSDIPKRSEKNKELYKQIYNAYDEFENLVVPSNVKEIDLSTLKREISSRDEYKKIKDYGDITNNKVIRKEIIQEEQKKENEIYDINELIKNAVKDNNKETKIESDVKDDYLKKLRLSDEDMEKEVSDDIDADIYDAAGLDAFFEETDTAYIGTPIDNHGRCQRMRAEFDKSEYFIRVKTGDDILAVHIPSRGALTREACEESYRRALEIFAYFTPQHDFKAFYCHSWMMAPELADILKPDSNVLAFQSKFQKYPSKTKGLDVMNFLFKTETTPYADLPENTSLQRTLKSLCPLRRLTVDLVQVLTVGETPVRIVLLQLIKELRVIALFRSAYHVEIVHPHLVIVHVLLIRQLLQLRNLVRHLCRVVVSRLRGGRHSVGRRDSARSCRRGTNRILRGSLPLTGVLLFVGAVQRIRLRIVGKLLPVQDSLHQLRAA